MSPLEAAKQLKSGQIVAIPTDTVYGLAADLHNLEAVEALFTLKNRPHDKPMLILAPNLASIEPFCLSTPTGFYDLAEAFWPGPLTLIVPVDTGRIPATVRANRPTAGFRIPDHPLALEILRQTGPLVVSSANLSTEPPALDADEARERFPELPIVDGGGCPIGVASTILLADHGKWKIVREGSIGERDVKRALAKDEGRKTLRAKHRSMGRRFFILHPCGLSFLGAT